MSEIEKKYFTNSSFHKFTSDIFELVNKSNISNFAKLSALNTKIATLATKAELKSKQNEIVKLETHDLSYFLDKTFVVNNSSPNMFVYQLTVNGLQLREDQGTEYGIGLKSDGVYTAKPKQYSTTFLNSIKLTVYRVRLQFENGVKE